MNQYPEPQNQINNNATNLYGSTVLNFIGSTDFRNYFIEKDGEKIDVLMDGRSSCAAFVSNVLSSHGLISGPHATINSTLKDMECSGLQSVAVPTGLEPFDVIIWEKLRGYNHIGFYDGNGAAISNSTSRRQIARHNLNFQPDYRAISGLFRLP